MMLDDLLHVEVLDKQELKYCYFYYVLSPVPLSRVTSSSGSGSVCIPHYSHKVSSQG